MRVQDETPVYSITKPLLRFARVDASAWALL